MLKLTDYIGLGAAEYSDELIGLRLSTRLHIGGKAGPSYIDVLLSGVSPLALTNALGLNYIKALGATEQNGTPTPDTPMDIVSNNGVVKVRHQSGLPLGYTLLDYIESTGTQYIDTGITDVTNSEFEVIVQQTSITGAFPTIMGALDVDSNYKVVCGLSTRDNTFYSQLGGLDGFIVSSVPNDTQKHTFKVTTTTNQQTLQVDDTAAVIGNYPITSTTDYSLTICARNKRAVSNFTSQKVFSVRIKKSGTLVRNFIPARRNSDSTLGMYDLVSNTFLTNAGTGNFTAGQDIDDLEIYADGTVETVNIIGKNLFDYEYFYDNYQIYSTSAVGRCPIKLKPNTTYTISTNRNSIENNSIVFVVSGSAINWAPNTVNNGVLTNSPRTVTTDSEGYLCLGIYVESERAVPESDFINGTIWVQIEQGTTATTYEPYYTGGIANAEMLLKVGDYKDNQELLTGNITRNVGVMVLDGTENWQSAGAGSIIRYLFRINDAISKTSRSYILSTHFIYLSAGQRVGGAFLSGRYLYLIPDQTITTVNDFKSWLADQYANGTPVIVVYPLAESTTETVTGQSLTASGNCTVTATGSLDNLELELSYKQGV